jgi:hypothetical protein
MDAGSAAKRDEVASRARRIGFMEKRFQVSGFKFRTGAEVSNVLELET